MSKIIYILLFSVVLFSCNSEQKKPETKVPKIVEVVELSKSQKILNEAIEAHGGDLYNTANYSFVFRKNTFTFKNDGTNYEYTKKYAKGDSTIYDVLNNGAFSRTINGVEVTLTEKELASGTGSINSVIYFATLPYKLNDGAVNNKFVEKITIKGQEYDVLEITFDQAGGGDDHDDQYYYWVNKNTKKIDYLAYNYSVNEGGVRFRSAYNTSVVDGITFQDYVNYKAAVGTPLKDLPALFEAEELKELSRIETENIINLNKK